MCGIAFTYNNIVENKALPDLLDKALCRLEHRGQDACGQWAEGEAAMGHQRLSIIDIFSSSQPMQDRTGRYVLSYNGEIYNYKELRAGLAEKWSFSTEGDTEVLLAGLVVHGPDFCIKMEGMWAFALWDKQEELLLLGRDRIGKKPLFYQNFSNCFSCASELPALSYITPAWSEDNDSTADYLKYGYFLPGTTAYKDVKEILPGHTAYWSARENSFRQQQYWQLPINVFPGSMGQARELLHDKLVASIKKRLVADVEVGAFLSGGIDSSLLVCLLAKELSINNKTFTIGFSQASYDESSFAKAVAEYCQNDHYCEVLKELEPDTLRFLINDHVGQPFADSSILPTALLARLAARHVKVVLSGDGADELFSGYQRYQARVIFQWYLRLPQVLRNSVEKLVAAFPEPMVSHSRSLLKKAHMFCQAARRQETENPYVAATFYQSEDFRKLVGDLGDRGHSPPSIKAETSLDDLKNMMAMDALIYLPQDIMTKVDRATMAHGLEARSPFLDSDLIEFAFSLPSKWHRRGISGKRMLRETFANMVPEQIWKRRKQGFAVPLNSWFNGSLGSSLKEITLETDHSLNSEFILAMLSIHQKGRRDYSQQLWMIYIYLCWRSYKIFSRSCL